MGMATRGATIHGTYGTGKKPGIVKPLVRSVVHYISLVWSQDLHLQYDKIGQHYIINNREKYTVFRETVSLTCNDRACTILVVGFHLRLIGSSRSMHWLFQRLCILTTPFWSGFTGFGTKLWLYEPMTNNYLGIYQWDTVSRAEDYVGTLDRILRPLSTRHSVWHELYGQTKLDEFIAPRQLGR